MMSSNGNIFRVTGPLCGEITSEFPSQKPATRSFDVFFDLRLSKQSRRQWFEAPSRSLWHHCNALRCFFGRWSLKWKAHQDDCPGRHWRCWRQASATPATTRAVSLTTFPFLCWYHYYCEVIMGAVASRITSLSIVYSTICSGANQHILQKLRHIVP